jgi:hypothetical protein
MKSSILKDFILGTTILVSIFPFTYIGINNIKHGPVNPRYEYMVMFLPVYFGLANVVMTNITPKIFNTLKHSIKNSLITGAITGLVLSIIGKYIKVHSQIFPGIDPKNVHMYAIILYSIVFTLVMRNINILFENVQG